MRRAGGTFSEGRGVKTEKGKLEKIGRGMKRSRPPLGGTGGEQCRGKKVEDVIPQAVATLRLRAYPFKKKISQQQQHAFKTVGSRAEYVRRSIPSLFSLVLTKKYSHGIRSITFQLPLLYGTYLWADKREHDRRS